MPDYQFYTGVFGGDSIPRQEFDRYAREGWAELEKFRRKYTLTPVVPDAEWMAVCQLAETLAWFDWAENGGLCGGVSVGSMAMTGVALPPVGPKAKSAELYRSACLYFDAYRGAEGRQ